MSTDFERALAGDRTHQHLKSLLLERRIKFAEEIGLTSLGWFGITCPRHQVKNIAESKIPGTEVKTFVCAACKNEESDFRGDEERHVLSLVTVFGYFCSYGCGNVKSKPNQKTQGSSGTEKTVYACVVCEKELE